jgi:hypothetical protein
LHVSNLVPYSNRDQKSAANINLRLTTVLDSTQSNMIKCRYVIHNADSVNTGDLAELLEPEAYPRPKENSSFSDIAERNISTSVLQKRNAPNGLYIVILSFYVDERGKLSNYHVIKDPGFGAAEEAIRLLKLSPKWIPARRKGNL